MIYKNCKIYGPYQSKKDKRFRIIIRFPNKKLKTISYPKYLMEKKLGRYLTENETVDHIDRDFENNKINNFQILNRIEHSLLDATRRKPINLICQVCGNSFLLRRDQIIQYKKIKTGPFCGKKCAGYASHFPEKYIKLPIKIEYYQLEK